MVWSPLAGGFLSGKFTRDKRGDNDSRRTVFDFPAGRQGARLRHHRRHGADRQGSRRLGRARRAGLAPAAQGRDERHHRREDHRAARRQSRRRRADAERRKRSRSSTRRARSSPNIRAGCWRGRPRAACRRRRRKDFRRPRPGGDSTGGERLRKVKWGVLGVAKIAVEKVIPAMQRGEVSEIAAIASRDLGKARAAADKLGIPRAYGSYEELLADPEIEAIYNPLPNELHVPWTMQGARGRQARAVREADRARRRRGAPADRGAQPLRQAGRRSLHGAFPSAMAPRARTCAGRGDRRSARDPDLLLLSAARPRECAQPAAGRRRALRHRLLRDPDRALHFRRRADPGRGRRSTGTRISRPTGWRARSSSSPAGAI